MLLDIQASVYQRYHMNDVKVFYQNEDLWQISSEIYGTKEQAMTPNYYIMKLPGENGAEFVNSIPFTPKDKKNLTGLLVARNDGDNYGKLVLYQMPKSKIVYGPEHGDFKGILFMELFRFQLQPWQYVRSADRRFSALHRTGLSGSNQFQHPGSKAGDRRIW